MHPRPLTLAVTLLVALASPAAAFDITGTWTGTRKCTLFASGAKTKTAATGTVEITQAGSEVGFLTAIGSTQLYSGIVNVDAAKPDKGELALLHCGSNESVGDPSTFDALGRFAVKTKPGKVKATISGTTFFTEPSVADPLFGTCKWKLTRTATTDPGVSTACAINMSRRAVKKNIAYLSDADLKRVHDELIAFRLASYQYTLPDASPASHLGFIIEDVAPSPSIAENGNRVDLYGHTSMAVAAVQTQAREIATLEEAVAKLEARLAKDAAPATQPHARRQRSK